MLLFLNGEQIHLYKQNRFQKNAETQFWTDLYNILEHQVEIP